jgi:hypothetical protein
MAPVARERATRSRTPPEQSTVDAVRASPGFEPPSTSCEAQLNWPKASRTHRRHMNPCLTQGCDEQVFESPLGHPNVRLSTSLFNFTRTHTTAVTSAGSRLAEEIREAAVPLRNGVEGLVDLRERERVVLEDRKVEGTGQAHFDANSHQMQRCHSCCGPTSASVVRHASSTVGRQPAAPLTRCDGAEVVGAAVVLRTAR